MWVCERDGILICLVLLVCFSSGWDHELDLLYMGSNFSQEKNDKYFNSGMLSMGIKKC